MTTADGRLTPDELRSLFLFEALTPHQLAHLSEHGRVEQRRAGDAVYVEGEPASCFYVLLSGTVAMRRRVQGDDVEVSRTSQRGVYGGAMQAYIGDLAEQQYANSLFAVTDCEVFALPAEIIAEAMRAWFPMATHLLEGLFIGMRNTQTIVGERERLLALGALSAGLTHELNNPAAAAVRATSALRGRVAKMRHKLALIADGRLDGRRLHDLVALQEEAVKRAGAAPPLTPLAASDAEDELADWLDDHGVRGAWEIAPTLVAGGIDAGWLSQVDAAVGADDLESAIHWITYTIDTELLMGEIDDAVGRISGLVGAAKQYSQLDRAPYQTVDVHDLLDATLVMLQAKIPSGVQVVKEYDETLPAIPAYAAELNQVWTNLIDNALGAMGGTGTLTIRTGRKEDRLIVEVRDTGSGIPPEIRPRIFEPFYTTKPVGEGTGLGLDISYRIIVNKHHGDIRVQSQPGDTRFIVLLPMASA
ncbi:ATP-binding protein [Micromonospora sp. DR5-3]|uniref:ATP-binding protein n=1 Tax=unclassified Micromonospora TaxID=2617518 RepID=UPI0011D8AF43|nr:MULTISPECIES: ATP-binding protein [unclassified Micromonospora]MCW3814340.1 ATP-binding protein [Micromonospora sp. DR5-3]TYC23371.1 cyclic nucleotide-binding domain-containing protein [Micromonospora sp. MP36]